MTDTTDAAAHEESEEVSRLRRHIAAALMLRHHADDEGSAFQEAYLSHLDDIETDLAALDAARIAAEQRADAAANALKATHVALTMTCDELEQTYKALEAEQTKAARLLSGSALQAATNEVGRMQRIDGPDPNGYVRFTSHDYARAAITAALDVAGYAVHGDLDAEPAPARAEGGDA